MATIYSKRGKLHIDYTSPGGKRKTVNLKISGNITNKRKAQKIKEEIEATLENKYIENNASTVESRQIFTEKNKTLTVSEAITKYYNGHIVLTSQKNQLSYRVAMSYLIKAVSGSKDIRNVEPEDVNKVINILKPTVSNSTLHTYLRYIKSLFNYLIEEDLIEKTPLKKKNLPRKEKNKVVPFTDKMYGEILKEARIRDYNFYKVLMMFGLIGGRPCDMLRLKDTNFDFEKDILRFKMSKTGREILFPIYKQLKDFINSEMPDIHKAQGKLIFKGLTVDAAGQRFRRIKKALGINERYVYTLKTFRKTFATRNSGKGMNLQELADLLGHEDMSTTKTYYTHVDVEKLKEKMNSF